LKFQVGVMTKELMTMSQQELDRATVIQQVVEKKILQKDAARQLDLSLRQIKRLVKRYRLEGIKGLISRHRGKSPNNLIPDDIRQNILTLVKTHYADFGPTLACEKLTQCHEYQLSVETLRQWMIADGLWKPKTRKQARIHQRRPRRPCRGELIQIDGSPHDWFEGRDAYCTLIVFIDDATSELMTLKFVPTETTQAYMETLDQYLQQHERPVALYSDKHSVFRVNHPDHEGDITQFTRALKTLDIAPIHANTPQAKGRVERANQTLQDRLVKEMRLQGISDIDSANDFLPRFIEDYNRRFAIAPQSSVDAHRPVLHSTEELALILSIHHTRKLSKNLTFQFKSREYQLQNLGKGYRLRGAQVTICEDFNDSVAVMYKGHLLDYRILAQGEPLVPINDEKLVHSTVEQAKLQQISNPKWKPPADHPWRRL